MPYGRSGSRPMAVACRTMLVAEAVGRALVDLGVEVVFGLTGSGNMLLSNALRDAGAAYYGARHEGGAVSMADGYARVSGKVGVCTVHQGPGLTNTTTGLTEAAKSRTPLLLLAADVPATALRSNFRIDQAGLAESVGAVVERVHGRATATRDAARALERARTERRTVVLMLPTDVQGAPAPDELATPPPRPPLAPPRPAVAAVEAVAELVRAARRPAIVAGRGAVRAGAGPALRALGERCGAVLATSAPANGLFAGDAHAIGIAGGFASPAAAELLRDSDLVLAFGATLNHWTTRHGSLIGPDARVVQVDLDPEAIGAEQPVDAGVIADAAAAAEALTEALGTGEPRERRTAGGGWRDEPFKESRTAGHIDPRTLSIALDEMLPEERTLVVDSGHFMGWPSMYMRVPDPVAFVFPQAFQCVGLGLGTAIGAVVARPDRLVVATLGDGGALMALPELETLARLGLPLLVVVYNDAAYAAEVHHFRLQGAAVDLAQFPDADLAALARAAGCRALTVRAAHDLGPLRDWLAVRDGPLLVDAKVDPSVCAEWLEDAFRH
jgi:thiamine pyrophosphate-dependent acetolactate synthase large subunit-like protein